MLVVAVQSRTDFLKLLDGHARVGRHHDCASPAFPAGQRLQVAFEQPGERLLSLPFGVLRRDRLDAIERKGELEIIGLLGPERAVIVESRDAFRDGDEIRSAFLGDALTKSMIAFFAALSFHDGSGSDCA